MPMTTTQNTAFTRLLRLPLFQGMSYDELTKVVAHTKMEFSKCTQGHVIAEADMPCTTLTFILNGDIEVTTLSIERQYAVIETLHSPLVLQPERLFGLHQTYTHTFTAATPCQLLKLRKSDVAKLAGTFTIFHINLLNIITTRAQKTEALLWRQAPATQRQRLIRFLTNHCQYPAGEKLFRIRMRDIGHELNLSRIDISRLLNDLQKDGLLSLSRGKIRIPQIEKLS